MMVKKVLTMNETTCLVRKILRRSLKEKEELAAETKRLKLQAEAALLFLNHFWPAGHEITRPFGVMREWAAWLEVLRRSNPQSC